MDTVLLYNRSRLRISHCNNGCVQFKFNTYTYLSLCTNTDSVILSGEDLSAYCTKYISWYIFLYFFQKRYLIYFTFSISFHKNCRNHVFNFLSLNLISINLRYKKKKCYEYRITQNIWITKTFHKYLWKCFT